MSATLADIGHITNSSCVHLPSQAVGSKLLLCMYAGKDVYVDVQGWHLFLKEITVEKDVKMHEVRDITLWSATRKPTLVQIYIAFPGS